MGGTAILKHEFYESDLVINQGMNQIDAHNLTQEIYSGSTHYEVQRARKIRNLVSLHINYSLVS